MSKRPSFQFYPADWRNNAKLRRCSEAARGVWMDILCILHDSDEYGICRWPLDELARSAGARLVLVKELVEKEVLKGAPQGKECEAFIYIPRSGRKNGNPVELIPAQPGPIWYCSRFVRDEYKANVRGSSSNSDTPKPPPNYSPKGGNGDDIDVHPTVHPSRAAPSSSSSTSLIKDSSSLNSHKEENSFTDRARLQFDLPDEWKADCKTEMGWPDNVIADTWTRFGSHYRGKIGQTAFKTQAEWAAEWRTWYRKENIKVAVKNADSPTQKNSTPAPVKTDEENRAWYREKGIQHLKFNPHGEKD